MRRQVFDRWADTRVFRFALFCAALAVAPVLALGVSVTLFGGATLLSNQTALDIEQALFGLLSIGGVLGLVGYARAHVGATSPDRHDVTMTLVCLAAGVVAALAVAGIAVYGVAGMLAFSRVPWSGQAWIGVPAVFVAANLVWAMSGVAWSQRLRRRYAEVTGHPFDGLPALLLFVALTLATAAATITTTL
jgi:hypothetical protein